MNWAATVVDPVLRVVLSQALVVRAGGEQGNTGLFDRALAGYRQLLRQRRRPVHAVHPFTFREIEQRGLINTGRAADTVRIIHPGLPDTIPVAPQGHIIERVTIGQVLLAGGQRDEAEEALRAALAAAETSCLPHQIQHTIRAAQADQLDGVAHRTAGQLSTNRTSPWRPTSPST